MIFTVAALFSASVATVNARVRPDNVGRLPALGWNSWNAFHCDISEDKFLDAAKTLVSRGFKDAGYQYVNIDDCWSVETGRDSATHKLLPNITRFPDGINGTAAKVHDMGLSIGIYSSAGTETCAGYPASIGLEKLDAETWASWDIDYVKYDNCYVPQNWTDECAACLTDLTDSKFVNGTCLNTTGLCPEGYDYSTSHTAERFKIMRDAIEAQSRTMLYSLCEWGTADVWTWGNQTGSSWRTTEDISPNWASVTNILNQNSFLTNYGGFFGHNDMDMLEVGNGDLTEQESRSHFALWAIMKSPLIIGTDLAALSQANVDILLNKYLLAFNQDETVGHSASPYKWGVNPDWTYNNTHPAEFWAGASSNGTIVAMMNTLDDTRSMHANFNEIPGLQKDGRYKVIDVWTGEDLGCQHKSVTKKVESHDTAVLLVQEGCGCRISEGGSADL